MKIKTRKTPSVSRASKVKVKLKPASKLKELAADLKPKLKVTKQQAASELLKRHQLKLGAKTKPQPDKISVKPKIERVRMKTRVQVEEPKAKPRKRLKNGGPNPEFIAASKAAYAAMQARKAAKAREEKGIVSPPLQVNLPKQHMLVLQVRNLQDEEWGILKAFNINAYTPPSQLDKYVAQLEELKLGWIISGYFGNDANFRIHEVVRQAQTVSY